MQVCQEYGLILTNSFGFIPGGSCDWPIEYVSSVQHQARNQNTTAFMFVLDATSAYDTVSHSGISMTCKLFAVPADVECLLLAHLGSHSSSVNTAYGLGDEDSKITLGAWLRVQIPLWHCSYLLPHLHIDTLTPTSRGII